MAGADRRVGQRYSHVYIDRGEPALDSVKARARIGHDVQRRIGESKNNRYRTVLDRIFASYITQEVGLVVTYNIAYWFDELFKKCEIIEFYDLITVTYRFFRLYYEGDAQPFVEFVRRVFVEQHVAFEIDDKGGIHPIVDREFSRAAAAAIAVLAGAPYVGILAEFENALRYLDPRTEDARSSIRAVYVAVESLGKLIAGEGRIARLGPPETEKHIKPKVVACYSAPAAANAAGLLIKSLSDWVTAAHQYRHGEEGAQADPPPRELAIAFVSQGASFLRWLAHVHSGLPVIE